MAKRKDISKKVRFEVFKRDSFTCQYCGKSAPDVILQIDHIDPVSNGGDNEIINLITSCFECNSGKSNRLLDDKSVIAKQQAQLAELNERREQLALLVQWRKGLKSVEDSAVEQVAEHWKDSIGGGFYLNENGLRDLKSYIKKYGASKVLESIEISVDRYLKFDESSKPTKESVEICFKKLSGICAVRSMPETEQSLRYIRGIVRNRMYCNEQTAMIILQNAASANVPIDKLTQCAKLAKNWSDWQDWMSNLIGEYSQ